MRVLSYCVVKRRLMLQIHQHKVRGIANTSKLACELDLPGNLINAKGGHIIRSLVTAVKKAPGWVKAETAWIVAASPLLTNGCQLSIVSHGENGDGIQ